MLGLANSEQLKTSRKKEKILRIKIMLKRQESRARTSVQKGLFVLLPFFFFLWFLKKTENSQDGGIREVVLGRLASPSVATASTSHIGGNK